jgi:hypothetical protein
MIDVNRGEQDSQPLRDQPSHGEQLLQLFVRHMMPELENETDERLALRKALLLLILCVQDEAQFGTEELIQYLLGAFPPLATEFDEHKHPLYRQHSAARAASQSGEKLVLIVGKSLIDELQAKPSL